MPTFEVDLGTSSAPVRALLYTRGVDIDPTEPAEQPPSVAACQPVPLTSAGVAATLELMTDALAAVQCGSSAETDETKVQGDLGESSHANGSRRAALSDVAETLGDLHEARIDFHAAHSGTGAALSDLLAMHADRRHATNDLLNLQGDLRHAQTRDPTPVGELGPLLDSLRLASVDLGTATRMTAYALGDYAAAHSSSRSARTDMHAATGDAGEAIDDVQGAPG